MLELLRGKGKETANDSSSPCFHEAVPEFRSTTFPLEQNPGMWISPLLRTSSLPFKTQGFKLHWCLLSSLCFESQMKTTTGLRGLVKQKRDPHLFLNTPIPELCATRTTLINEVTEDPHQTKLSSYKGQKHFCMIHSCLVTTSFQLGFAVSVSHKKMQENYRYALFDEAAYHISP